MSYIHGATFNSGYKVNDSHSATACQLHRARLDVIAPLETGNKYDLTGAHLDSLQESHHRDMMKGMHAKS